MKKQLFFGALALTLCLGSFTACGKEEHQCDFGKWKVEKEATCAKEGVEVRECDCGEEETRAIKKLEHTYTSAVTTAATCAQEGVTTFTCSGCQNTYTEPIPVTEHAYTSALTTQPTCAQEGVTTFTCSGCSHQYTESAPIPVYEATEIGEMYKSLVGEVTVSDYLGNEFSLGSCFVISEDGKLVTNYHVIENGYSAKVDLGGTTYEVKQVLAYSTTLDIAILKIDATGLTPSTLCKLDHKIGETVYTYGSSKGMTGTFAAGMISTSVRDLNGVKCVQHDAPISSGNSGGPLINKHGEVIGINTWTLQDSQNLNFAIHLTELDKLDYSTPMTMAQVYEKECDAFTRLKNYVIANGTIDTEDGCYSVTLGSDSNSSGNIWTRKIYYYYNEDLLSLDCIVDNEFLAYFYIDSSLSGIYDWGYNDVDNRKMGGALYAYLFTSGSLLTYNYHNNVETGLVAQVQEYASTMIRYLCTCLDADLARIGVAAEDLMFVYF